MANTRSALKAHRAAERRTVRNRSVRSATRTFVKKARTSLAKGGLEEAKQAVVQAATELDKAAGKGIIHRNAASRRKSRLMRQLAVLATSFAQSQAAAPAAPARRTRAAAGTRKPAVPTTRARTTRAPKAPEPAPPVEETPAPARAPRRRSPRTTESS